MRGAEHGLAQAQKRVEALGPGPSHNYVTFSSDFVDILRKYGIAGMLPAGVAGGYYSGQE